jgi:NADH-quinone oxidoreductase subunit E
MNMNMNTDKKQSGGAADISLIEPVLKEYAGSRGGLITVLQKAQEIYGWLPADVLALIAKRLGVKPSKVMGVVTFYAQFRTRPVGRHLILVCQGTACHVNGSSAIEEGIRDYLRVNEGEISEGGIFTYENVACLGCCSLSPVMTVDGKAYGNLTRESAAEILKTIARGEAAT